MRGSFAAPDGFDSDHPIGIAITTVANEWQQDNNNQKKNSNSKFAQKHTKGMRCMLTEAGCRTRPKSKYMYQAMPRMRAFLVQYCVAVFRMHQSYFFLDDSS